jgi:carboxylesterase type B
VAQGYFRVTMKLPLCLDGVITTGVQAFKKHILGWEEKHWGVCHADEMALFFKMHQLLSVIGQKHPEYTFSKEMVRQWVHFAVEG